MNPDEFYSTDQITPKENRIEIVELTAHPYQDRSRIKISFRLSFFQEPPNATIMLRGREGEEVVSVEIVNISQPDNEVTLHIPSHHARQGEYQVELILFHLREQDIEGNKEGEIKLTSQKINARRTTFTVP